MWPLAILAVLLSVIGLASTTSEMQRTRPEVLASDAVATNMLVYDRAAAVYATTNPNYNGQITPAMLSLPSWYQNVGGWRSSVSNKSMVTYKTATTRFSPDIMDALMRHTEGQLLVGRRNPDSVPAPSPITCWGFISPKGGCVVNFDQGALFLSNVSPGDPAILRRFQ